MLTLTYHLLKRNQFMTLQLLYLVYRQYIMAYLLKLLPSQNEILYHQQLSFSSEACIHSKYILVLYLKNILIIQKGHADSKIWLRGKQFTLTAETWKIMSNSQGRYHEQEYRDASFVKDLILTSHMNDRQLKWDCVQFSGLQKLIFCANKKGNSKRK
jgi:hypothetical protein